MQAVERGGKGKQKQKKPVPRARESNWKRSRKKRRKSTSVGSRSVHGSPLGASLSDRMKGNEVVGKACLHVRPLERHRLRWMNV